MDPLLKNQRGIALMLVLGSLLILTTIAVEFAYNAHVSYDLASAERDRLKATYLARSAFNLVKLELRVERQLRNQFAGVAKNLSGATGMSADPFCKQVPISTELLKGIAATGENGEEGAGEEAQAGDQGTKEKEKVKEKGEKKKAPEGAEMVQGAGEFLDFDGDFQVTCDTEERKLNLNAFREPLGVAPLSSNPSPDAPLPPYEEQKNLLAALLSQKEFESLFKGKPDEIRRVANTIADWADRDDRISEGPGLTGGEEDSLYRGPEYHYKVKNGKYATVAELLLVAGVGDDLYGKLAPQVTVYGDPSGRINLCQASDTVVKAFILKHSRTAGANPVNPEDEDRWKVILKAVRAACNNVLPKVQEVVNAIVNLVGGNAANLTKQITTDNRFYRIEATGEVNESRVKIVGVIDTGGRNPNLWKTVYFRVE